MWLVRDLTALYQPFQFLTIVIKKLLAANGLNQAYHGGLSSYSTVLWVTAALNHVKEDELDYGNLLLRFLNLFGN
jgi:DNA polymerase sigma